MGMVRRKVETLLQQIIVMETDLEKYEVSNKRAHEFLDEVGAPEGFGIDLRVQYVCTLLKGFREDQEFFKEVNLDDVIEEELQS